MQLYFFETKLPNFKLKTRPKQLLGSLPLVIALHDKASIVHTISVLSTDTIAGAGNFARDNVTTLENV
jgi:hypothetical protein